MKVIAIFEVETPKKVPQLKEYLEQVTTHMALVTLTSVKEQGNDKPSIQPEIRQEGNRKADGSSRKSGNDRKDGGVARAPRTKSEGKP